MSEFIQVVEKLSRSYFSKKDSDTINAGFINEAKNIGLFDLFLNTEFTSEHYSNVITELAKFDSSSAVMISAHNSLFLKLILQFGNKKQLAKYSNKVIGCFCISEPEAGSDFLNMQTTAKKDGSGYIIDGTKSFITNGSIADAGIIFAKTRQDKGVFSLTAFLVDFSDNNIHRVEEGEKLGVRGLSTARISFNNVKVSTDAIIGELNRGYEIAIYGLDHGRIGIASQALGLSMRALMLAKEYCQNRIQFGVKIATHQAIKFYIAEMSTRIEALRCMISYTCKIYEEGKDIRKYSAQIKLLGAECAKFCADKALQIFGANGLFPTYMVEKLYRDAKVIDIYEGTSEIMKLIIAAEELKL